MSKKNHCAVCDIIYPMTYDSCPLCEALQELKYLCEHMENAGGDKWADAETHEIRSYLRSIVRGCKIKV